MSDAKSRYEIVNELTEKKTSILDSITTLKTTLISTGWGIIAVAIGAVVAKIYDMMTYSERIIKTLDKKIIKYQNLQQSMQGVESQIKNMMADRGTTMTYQVDWATTIPCRAIVPASKMGISKAKTIGTS